MGREVITLQFGGFANYVGAHYWNFQDELLGLQELADGRGPAAQIDTSVLYRSGETLAGEGTYTPRLVLWDLSGALGGVPAGGSLYRDAGGGQAAVVSTWAGRQEVHRAAAVPRSRFAAELESEAEAAAAAAGGEGEQQQDGPTPLELAAQQLDAASGSGGSGGREGGGREGGGVRFWTDYLKAHLHPRSVHQLAGAWQGVTPFASWGDGGEHWRSEEQREEMMERIRFFAEEADSLQGFQVLAEDLSGWGQLAAHVLQEVRDEYGSGLPVMLYALRPQAASAAAAGAASPAAAEAEGGGAAERRRRCLNEGLSLAQLAPRCSTYAVVAPPAAPAALPLLRWQAGNAYHESALCAAALDTATLPYRLAGGGGHGAAIGRTDMWGLAHLLTAQHSTPLAALSLSLPCPPLPADMQQAAAAADARVQQGPQVSSSAGSAGPLGGRNSGGNGSSGGSSGGSGSGGGGGSGGAFTSQWLASLTPGIPAAGDAARFAESVVLRGPRAAGAPVQLDAAASALDAALATERVRCVRLRTLVAQPLAVPLPFPHMWARGLSREGDVRPGWQLGGSSGSGREHDIASCSVLTRLGGTAGFGPAVAAARRAFRSTARSAQGQATLEGWGLGGEEVGELEEQLERLARAYEREEA